MDSNLYDEFGNYIGPELDDSDDESDVDGFEENRDTNGNLDQTFQNGELVTSDMQMDVVDDENRIVLHEDKKYYPDANEVYPGVRTVTLDEDAQDLNEPIIKPVKTKNFSVLEKEPPLLKYNMEFMTLLMKMP